MNKVHFGIDFGTTSSSICYFNKITNKFSLLNKNNSKKISSKVYLYKDKFFIKSAKNFKEISYFKRDINKISFNQDNKQLNKIIKIYLNYLKEIIQNNFNQNDLPTVFTVPTSYNHYHRSWYKNLLEQVGFSVKRIISEPSAAAIAYYTLNKNVIPPKNDDLILIIDLGGGTTDVSLLEKDNNFYQVIYNKGDLYLGGEDFTKELSSSLGISIKNAEERKLKNNYEDIKYYSKNLNKLDKLINIIKSDISDNLDNIKDVILVGNGLKLLGIFELLESKFPGKLRTCKDQEYLVSYGAGILSTNLDNISSDLVIIDSTSLSLGIETADLNFSIIIPSNSPLPASGVRKYLPSDDNERKISLTIYQGEHSLAINNEIVGKLVIPSNPKIYIDSIYQVKLTLDLNGIIYVKIRDLSDKDYKYDKVLKFNKSENINNLKKSEKDISNEREFRRIRYEINYMISQINIVLDESNMSEDERDEIKLKLNNLLNNCKDYPSAISSKNDLDTNYGHLQYNNKKDGFNEIENVINTIDTKDYSDNLTNKYLMDKLKNYLDLEKIRNSDLKDIIENLIENFNNYKIFEIKSKLSEIDQVLETNTSFKEFKELILTIEYEVESNNLELLKNQKKIILERLEIEKQYLEDNLDIDYNNKINIFNKFCEDLLNL